MRKLIILLIAGTMCSCSTFQAKVISTRHFVVKATDESCMETTAIVYCDSFSFVDASHIVIYVDGARQDLIQDRIKVYTNYEK